MKRLLTAALAVAAALAFGQTASAQRLQEYGYPHSIDMQFGYNISPLKVAGDKGTAWGMSDGGSYSIRYTGYFSDHFGVYAGFGFYGNSLDQRRYFGIVDRADGHQYRYGSDTYIPFRSNYAPVLTAGLASRFDAGQFSFRPRLGLGRLGYKMQSGIYTRQDGLGREEVEVIPNTSDYLLDRNYGGRIPALAIDASLQLTYTFFEHFYLSAEAGLMLVPQTMYVSTRVDGKKVSMDRMSIPDIASVKFGIGWNIGWNRNYRRYHRPLLF